MSTKTAKILDYLELIPEPSTLDILEIQRKVGCSERLVWRGLRIFRERREKLADDYSLLKDLFSDLQFCITVITTKSQPNRSFQAADKRKLNEIGERLDYYQSKVSE